jgi:hypothetical protein
MKWYHLLFSAGSWASAKVSMKNVTAAILYIYSYPNSLVL